MPNSRVSIVIPLLNARPFLAEAIESVISQVYTDWELPLVDDGSPDGSAAVAATYAAREPERIRLLATSSDSGPKGASAARNLALSRAGGEFVAFLDADDVSRRTIRRVRWKP